MITLLQWPHAKSGNYLNLPKSKQTHQTVVQEGIWTTNQMEFLPKKVTTPPSQPASFSSQFINQNDQIEPRITDTEIKNGYMHLFLAPGTAGKIIVNQHWHPGWHFFADGKPLKSNPYTNNKQTGIALNVPANTLSVTGWYGYTNQGKAGLRISLVTAIICLIGLFSRNRQSLISIRWFVMMYGIFFGFIVQSNLHATPDLNKRISQLKISKELSSLNSIKAAGTYWKDPANTILDQRGLRIQLGQLMHNNSIELSVDTNDTFLLVYLHNNKAVAQSIIRPTSGQHGLTIHNISVPIQAQQNAYDELALLLIGGDGLSSVGHVILKKPYDRKQNELIVIFEK